MYRSSVLLSLAQGTVSQLVRTGSPVLLKPVLDLDFHEVHCLKQFHCSKHVWLISTLTNNLLSIPGREYLSPKGGNRGKVTH